MSSNNDKNQNETDISVKSSNSVNKSASIPNPKKKEYTMRRKINLKRKKTFSNKNTD